MLILSFAYHVEQLNASQQRLCPTERLKSQHQTYSSLDISVVLLNQVIQILVLPDANFFLIRFVGVERRQRCGVSSTFVGTVAKLAMRQPFILLKGLTFQKLCSPDTFRPGDAQNKMIRPGLSLAHASLQSLLSWRKPSSW